MKRDITTATESSIVMVGRCLSVCGVRFVQRVQRCAALNLK